MRYSYFVKGGFGQVNEGFLKDLGRILKINTSQAEAMGESDFDDFLARVGYPELEILTGSDGLGHCTWGIFVRSTTLAYDVTEVTQTSSTFAEPSDCEKAKLETFIHDFALPKSTLGWHLLFEIS